MFGVQKVLLEQNEEYLDYIKNEEESIIERIVNKYTEQYFATMFEGLGHETSLILLLSLTEPDILRQSKFTDHEIRLVKNLAAEKVQRQRLPKEYVAVSLIE